MTPSPSPLAHARPALRAALVVAGDAAAALVAASAAWSIRFEGGVPAVLAAPRRLTLLLFVGVRVLVLVGARLHRWSFTAPGMPEALRVVTAQLAGSAVVAALVAAAGLAVPRSIYPLELLVSTALVAGMRYGPRIVGEWRSERRRAHQPAGVRTVIAGAGHTGELLARDVLSNPRSSYRLAGFVDDAAGRRGTTLLGKPVLGRLDDLPRLAAERGVELVLVATAELDAERIRRLLEACAGSRVRFKILPASLLEMHDRITASRLHDLAPEHLLPRDSIRFDEGELRGRVRGLRALVTGAGGSIGSEIARQLAAYEVAELVLVDMNENELYVNARLLAQEHPGLTVHPEVADVREAGRIRRLGARHRPDLVFHAAAHKHVPLMEEAPEEAVKNNVFGTLNVARMAGRCGAWRFVLISTDKAVHPTSVMGATKRVAELVVRDLARAFPATGMTAVRFGNVLGSAGSVVPIFKRQIERGGPVTVTHPECTRYFMTIPEAVGLVLVAGLRCEGELCVLDMGEPVRIVDLARHLITLAGRVPGDEIPIAFIGLRPGEKLCEEVLTEEEEVTETVRDGIRVVSPALSPPPHLRLRLAELRRLAAEGDTDGILALLRQLVSSFQVTRGAPLLREPGRPAFLTPRAAGAHQQAEPRP